MGRAEIEAAQAMLGIIHTQPRSAIGDGVVLVCVDCEAYEMAQHKITEIGISVLDTRTVRHLSPTDSADQWFSKIASRHFRITEHAHLINSRYIKGNPEAFAFGTSKFIEKQDAKSVLQRVFEGPVVADADQVVTRRDVVVVGHGLKNDMKFLQHLGFSFNGIPNIVRRLDTQSLVGSKKDNVGLSRLLRVLDIEVRPEHLHNAGNDAAYTLQAFVQTALKEHAVPGSVSSAIQAGRAEAGIARATRKVTREAGGAVTESSATHQVSETSTLPLPDTHHPDTSIYQATSAQRPVHWQGRSMEDYEPTIIKMSRRQEKLTRRAERAAKLADSQGTPGDTIP